MSGVRDPIGLLNALRGLRVSVRGERNLRLHLLAAVVAFFVTWWLNASWLPIVFAVGLVISLELLNTAVEAAVDLHTDRHDPLAQRAKDAAAAAVLVAAGVAVLVALLNWGPPLLDRLKLVAS